MSNWETYIAERGGDPSFYHAALEQIGDDWTQLQATDEHDLCDLIEYARQLDDMGVLELQLEHYREPYRRGSRFWFRRSTTRNDGSTSVNAKGALA